MEDKEKSSGAGYTSYFDNMKKVCEDDRSKCNSMIDDIAQDYCCSSLSWSCCC